MDIFKIIDLSAESSGVKAANMLHTERKTVRVVLFDKAERVAVMRLEARLRYPARRRN